MTDLTPEELDRATVDLIFALRDSLTDVSPLDFWTGRVATALETAAAGSESLPQAVTTACRKLQIPVLTRSASHVAASVVDRVPDYEEWAGHVSRNIVYIVALARVENDTRKQDRQVPGGTMALASMPVPTITEGTPF